MKKKSYLLLVILLIALAFIGGTRYGQRVEQVNETISFIVSITPKQITTTPAPLDNYVNYKEYANPGCGIHFLYPAILKTSNSALSGGLHESTNKDVLFFECSEKKDTLDKKIDFKTVATISADFQTKKTQMYKKDINGQEYYIFSSKHPYRNIYIQYTVRKNFIALLEKTLEYVR